MKTHVLRYLPRLNQQVLAAIYVILILVAMALAGGAPLGNAGTGV